MEKSILSLKNIYRFLFVNDYPIYSTGIISTSNKKGYTLVKYWEDILLREFRNHKYGKMIWRNDGTHNRYLSEMCNRSPRLKFYKEYMQELQENTTAFFMNSQISQFASFLQDRQFSFKVFLNKLWAFLDLIAKEDPVFDIKAKAFFEENQKYARTFEKYGAKGQAFYCGWYLTFLTFHALAGEYMGCGDMQSWRMEKEWSLTSMWKLFQQQNRNNTSVKFLTKGNSELCAKPLPRGHFFGREKELFELKEMLRRGGHYLLSGIGGVGKTELLRQFLKQCTEERLVDCICEIQYEGSLASSFVRAFGQRNGENLENNFRETLAKIRSCKDRTVLILIDNVDQIIDDDPNYEEVLELPACIFLTSRIIEMKGFTSYMIKTLSKEHGMLIFRDNYEYILEHEEQDILEKILKQDVWCHTLTLQFLGKVAKSQKWSIQELQIKLEKQGVSFGATQQEITTNFRDLCKQVYSLENLNHEEREILRLMAILPYRTYSNEFLAKYLSYIVGEDTGLLEIFMELKRYGWLEQSEQGFSMHPFIAECLFDGNLEEKDVLPFFRGIEQTWKELYGDIYEDQGMENFVGSAVQEELDVAEIIIHVAGKVKGAWCASTVNFILLACDVIDHALIMPKTAQIILKSVMDNCADTTDIMLIRYYIFCHNSLDIEFALMENIFEQQKKEQTISDEMLMDLQTLLFDQYFLEGRIADAKKVLDEYNTEKETLKQQIIRCINRGQIAINEGNYEQYIEWNEKGIELALKEPEKFSFMLFRLIGAQSGVYSAFKQLEKAREYIEKLEKIANTNDSMQMQWYLAYYQGSLEINSDNLEAGVEKLIRSKELSGYYFGTNNYNYVMQCEELALGLQRMQRWEEAEENHKIALEIVKNGAENRFQYSRILNNLGVTYLEWNKLDLAQQCLIESYQLGEKIGGLAAAEPAYNLSRLYRLEENREKEIYCLECAYSVFEKMYGEDNAKTRDAKERLNIR